MKIMMKLPYKEIPVDEGYFSYEFYEFEVEVLKLRRYETGVNTKRYYYHAYIIPPKEVLELCKCPKHKFLLEEDKELGLVYCGNINRKLNKTWKPPKEGWENNNLKVER